MCFLLFLFVTIRIPACLFFGCPFLWFVKGFWSKCLWRAVFINIHSLRFIDNVFLSSYVSVIKNQQQRCIYLNPIWYITQISETELDLMLITAELRSSFFQILTSLFGQSLFPFSKVLFDPQEYIPYYSCSHLKFLTQSLVRCSICGMLRICYILFGWCHTPT